MQYEDFISSKNRMKRFDGIESDLQGTSLYDFQQHLCQWALAKGRAAIFADCGLGKTPMQLYWAHEVSRYGRVLIVTPLAVAEQTDREGRKFGINATKSKDGTLHDITITNYERLGYFAPSDFVGIVCDESSILKNYAGKTREAITEFAARIKYRLLCTATPAPNDFMELGTSAEALGVMRRVEMLSVYFTHDSGSTQKWDIKGHAEKPFWQFVASWARAIRKPSDLGFADGNFVLPSLNLVGHTIASTPKAGQLFVTDAITLDEQRAERNATMQQRCEKVAEIANSTKEPFLAWCSLNDESKLLTKLINGAVEVSGSMSDEAKESAMLGFSDGSIRCIVTKPRIAGFGMNWQHCNRMSFFPSHSHEQFYQSVRRCWRFGQNRPVECHIVASEAERSVLENMRRKEEQSARMFEMIIDHMNFAIQEKKEHKTMPMEVPQWLKSA